MNWLTALFQAILEGFKFGTKAIAPDEIRIAKSEEKKELREQDSNQHLINDSFQYLKRRTEINVWDYCRNVHAKMTPDEMVLFHKILQARVYEYRYDRPVIYRKWIKENPKNKKGTP